MYAPSVPKAEGVFLYSTESTNSTEKIGPAQAQQLRAFSDALHPEHNGIESKEKEPSPAPLFFIP